jgi:hypothetical protein
LKDCSPKFIFFDAAGTLIHLPRGVAAHYREVAERHGFVPEEEKLGAAFSNAFRTLPPPLTTRLPRPDDDRGWWRTLVHHVVEEAGAPPCFNRDRYFLYQIAPLVGPARFLQSQSVSDEIRRHSWQWNTIETSSRRLPRHKNAGGTPCP